MDRYVYDNGIYHANFFYFRSFLDKYLQPIRISGEGIMPPFCTYSDNSFRRVNIEIDYSFHTKKRKKKKKIVQEPTCLFPTLNTERKIVYFGNFLCKCKGRKVDTWPGKRDGEARKLAISPLKSK